VFVLNINNLETETEASTSIFLRLAELTFTFTFSTQHLTLDSDIFFRFWNLLTALPVMQ